VVIVDAQVIRSSSESPSARNTGYATQPPLQRFLANCYEEFKSDNSGAVADYIPELRRANPAHFGVALVTIDGHIYEVGDSAVPFTIQSVSKAFVFALALEMVGEERVAAAIGVEPSGEAFNSIRLTNDNRPFNPMVNAGAIAVASLIKKDSAAAGVRMFIEKMQLAAGRKLRIDGAVLASETTTGNRNRAIAYLMLNFGIIDNDVNHTLQQYFSQCSLLVNCRDLAIMAATLANMGTNPVTAEPVFDFQYIKDVLAVMFTCGLYDHAGEWAYRVGLPAKSGVGGGLLAVVNRQLGIAVYSPRLDAKGNSVRGIMVCRELADRLGLHAFEFTNVGSSFMQSML